MQKKKKNIVEESVNLKGVRDLTGSYEVGNKQVYSKQAST